MHEARLSESFPENVRQFKAMTDGKCLERLGQVLHFPIILLLLVGALLLQETTYNFSKIISSN